MSDSNVFLASKHAITNVNFLILEYISPKINAIIFIM